MAEFRVSAAQLRAKADELSNLNSSYKTNVSELEGCEQNLMGMWDGEAKDRFHTEFNKDKSQMTAFSALIDKYVAALLEIAAKYEKAEAQALELASTRTY